MVSLMTPLNMNLISKYAVISISQKKESKYSKEKIKNNITGDKSKELKKTKNIDEK